MAEHPFMQCPLCEHYGACKGANWERYNAYGSCYRDSRTVDIDLQARHLRRLADDLNGNVLPADLEHHILEPVRRAQGRMSRPIEFSVSYRGTEEFWYRLSVAYSDDEPERLSQDARLLLDTLRLFDPPSLAAIAPIIENPEKRLVRQILYGLDLRPAKASRQKLYLRLNDGCEDLKIELIKRLRPGFDVLQSAHTLDYLRLIGIDLPDKSGELDLKLYFTYDVLSSETANSITMGHPFVEFVSKGRPNLRELLLIQKLPGGRELSAVRTDEIDLHLIYNQITLKELMAFVAEYKLGLPLRRFVDFYKDSLVVPTSVTFSMHTLEKMNLYYVLAGESRDA